MAKTSENNEEKCKYCYHNFEGAVLRVQGPYPNIENVATL